MDKKPEQPTTVYREYIDGIKRGGTKYARNAVDAPVESVGAATEFCRPCFAYVQPGHICPTWRTDPRRGATHHE